MLLKFMIVLHVVLNGLVYYIREFLCCVFALYVLDEGIG